MPNQDTIGARIRAARRRADLTQGELGALVGAKQSRVAEWESGQHVPGGSSLAAIAKALDLTLDYLIHGIAPAAARPPNPGTASELALDALDLSRRLSSFAAEILGQDGPRRAEPAPLPAPASPRGGAEPDRGRSARRSGA